jgi:predicted transcriptional regulator
MKIQITQKPFSISSNARVVYRIIQLLLILHFSRRKSAFLSKIHLLIWILEKKERMDLLLRSKKLNYNKSIGLWNISNYTNQALLYMYEDGFCEIKGRTYSLTDKGKKFIKKIIDDKEVFLDEKAFFKQLGLIREKDIKKLEKLEKLWIH